MVQASIERSGLTLTDLAGSPKRHRREKIVRAVFLGAALLSVAISVAIVLSLAGGTIDYLTKVDLSQMLVLDWFPRREEFGLPAIFAGSVVVSLIAMLVAAPLGLGAALYLSEFAKPRSRRVPKPVLETLASVPSVVMGFFALRFISPDIVQRLFSGAEFFNFLAAGVAVGLLVTPLVASVAEDALHAVPLGLREASFGLGAKLRTTSLKIVVPAAVSGITAALILGMSRAIGETMIVAIAAGGTGGSLFQLNPFAPGQTMTGAMTALAIGSDQVRGEALTFESLFFVGMLLFLLTLALNLASDAFVRRVRSAY